jgi:hypothetical protein
VRRFLLIGLFLLCGKAAAQELDIFDINDFVDPRALGATVSDTGRLQCPCRHFLASRFLTGRVNQYDENAIATRANVFFGRLATSYYAGLWQLNWKSSILRAPGNIQDVRPLSRLITPRQKHSLQVGRYWAIGTGRSDSEPVMLRAEVSWALNGYHGIAVRRPRHPVSTYQSFFGEELGLEVDTSLPLLGRRISGSFVIVGGFDGGQRFSSVMRFRSPAEAFRNKRVSYVYRLPRVSGAGVSFDATFGAETFFRHWTREGLILVPSLEATSQPVPKLGTRVHLRYEPSIYRPGRTTHQLAVFIDQPVLLRASR